jgi:hypothetical protein
MGFTFRFSCRAAVRDSPALVKDHTVPVNGITWQVSPTEKASFLRNLNLIYSTSPPLRGPSPEERDKTLGNGFHAVPVNEKTWQVSPTEKASFLRNLNLIYSTSPPLRGPSPEERDKTLGDGFHAVPVNERLDRAGVLTADEK